MERTGAALFLSAMPRPLTVDRYRVISAADFRVMSLTRIRPHDDTLHFGLSSPSGGKRRLAADSEQPQGRDLATVTRVPSLLPSVVFPFVGPPR